MKNILFVDDHEVLARLSCEILEMQGYRAVSAYDGEDALRKFAHGEFDMVVTDFRMQGMNGVELSPSVFFVKLDRLGKLPKVIEYVVDSQTRKFILDLIRVYSYFNID